MKIYLAGMTQVGGSDERFQRVRNLYPYDLESYHYIRSKPSSIPHYQSLDKRIFLDSGAYTMFTQGIELNVEEYAQYILDNAGIIDLASNMDLSGKTEKDCQATYDNQKRLEALGCKVQPVFHTREDEKWLRRYLAEGYDYVFIGGMVPETTPFLLDWLDHIWEKYLCNPDGTAKVKVHGFGLTTDVLMWRYPWYSVDSTSWIMTTGFGGIYVDMPHRDVKVNISSRSPSTKNEGQHWDNLDPVSRKAVLDRILELGYDPEDLRERWEARAAFNVEYFARLMERPDPVFQRKAVTLF